MCVCVFVFVGELLLHNIICARDYWKIEATRGCLSKMLCEYMYGHV